MAEEQKADGEREAGSTPVKVPDRKVHRAYSKVRRELSEDELATPGAQRLLLDELDRLQRQVDELSAYRGQFHEADKRAAVLKQKLEVAVAGEIISGICLTVGAALVGIAPALWDKKPYGVIVVAAGIVLLVGGVLAKVIRK